MSGQPGQSDFEKRLAEATRRAVSGSSQIGSKYRQHITSDVSAAPPAAPPAPGGGTPAETQTAPPPPLPPPAEPLGTGAHVVRVGECVSSIAFAAGHFWQTLWDDPANSAVREARSSPNTLLPGDRLAVMPLRRKEEDGQTGQRHRFRRKGAPETYRVQLLTYDQPRANISYTLQLGTQLRSGTTDADGYLEEPIPPGIRRGRLTLANDESYDIEFGHLEPLPAEDGVKQRLINLGFLQSEHFRNAAAYRDALLAFQKKYELQPLTGEADVPTCDKLREVYGA